MSTVKHLVLSGGGPLIFQTIGIMQELEKNNTYSRSNIKSIYGTSSGAIVGLFICLGYDWDVINKFMIERPWDNLYYIDTERLFNGFKQCGIYNHEVFIKSYKSLFDAKDISIDITLSDFYKLTKIDYHLISFEVNKLQMEDLSHETYPDLKVMDAIHMTACLPIIFTPVLMEEKCFIDGGIILNYPLNLCIDKYPNTDEIIGVKHIYTNNDNEKNITSTTNILEYIINIFYKLIRHISLDKKEENTSLKHEILCYENYMTFQQITSCLTSSKTRQTILENGIKIAKKYCENINLEDRN
jgi:predicted acylesterase/phospholipase RssA